MNVKRRWRRKHVQFYLSLEPEYGNTADIIHNLKSHLTSQSLVCNKITQKSFIRRRQTVHIQRSWNQFFWMVSFRFLVVGTLHDFPINFQCFAPHLSLIVSLALLCSICSDSEYMWFYFLFFYFLFFDSFSSFVLLYLVQPAPNEEKPNHITNLNQHQPKWKFTSCVCTLHAHRQHHHQSLPFPFAALCF